MARQTLPDSVEKRNLLHAGKASPGTLLQLGKAFEAARRLPDALDFFAKAGDAEGVARIKAVAIETGNSFLLVRARRVGPVEVARDEWLAAAAAAERAGRWLDAYWCAKESGDEEKIAALEEKMRSTGGPSGNGSTGTAPGKSPL